MESVPHAAPTPQNDSRLETVRNRPAMEETVYRMMTVCAILLVLGSLWLF